jgi:predicted anti-sigma-YlaC factor YlaD
MTSITIRPSDRLPDATSKPSDMLLNPDGSPKWQEIIPCYRDWSTHTLGVKQCPEQAIMEAESQQPRQWRTSERFEALWSTWRQRISARTGSRIRLLILYLYLYSVELNAIVREVGLLANVGIEVIFWPLATGAKATAPVVARAKKELLRQIK